jgi:hypothetical protein
MTPRILKVTYRSGVKRRTVTFYTKVPYGGMYELTEKLTRMLSTGQILWFRIGAARPAEITPEIRASLERWLPAIHHTTSITGVDWNT